MKAAQIATVFLLAFSTAARGQTEGIAEFKGQTSLGERTLPSHVRVLVGSKAFRIEMEVDLQGIASRPAAGNPGIPTQARIVMIAKRSEPNKLYILNDQRRSFAILDASKARQSIKGDGIYTKTLGRDSIAGLSCEKALVTLAHGGETEVCVTHEIGASGAWVDAINGRNQGSSVFRALRANGLEGFPIQWLIRSGREKLVTSFELVHFEKKSVPASVLEIPAGYQETNSMGVWFSPDQEKAMHDAQKKALDELTLEQRKKYEAYLKQDKKER